jgi:hypothetical protein
VLQDTIPVRIEVSAGLMHAPIHLDHEASLGADQVGDEATHDHLAAEGEAQAAAFERRPEAPLGEGGVVTKVMGARFELELTMGDVARG